MFDLVVKNVHVVRPNKSEVEVSDIGITDGRFAAIGVNLDDSGARVIDGTGLHAFPGVVDAHMHFGIYHPLSEDIVTESRTAATGGVTSGISYMRTGKYYLNKGGPYADFMPEVLATSEGNSFIDYGYHLAPMTKEHITEIPELIERFGVPSYKIFMFYGSHGLHGRSDDQNAFLMTPPDERYDYAHFEFIMRGARAAMDRFPEAADYISVSLHCETAEIMRAYTRIVEEEGELSGLAAYNAARPPHSEGLAIAVASYLAHETNFPNINLLHLSSEKAIESARLMAETFPHVNFRREVTISHLMTDYNHANGLYGKVNPPLRPRSDVEALWSAVADGTIDWVISDHACCSDEFKIDPGDRDNVWLAKSGFGGTEFILPGMVSEAQKRDIPFHRVAELVSWNAAQRYGLRSKGTIEVGYDADLALIDTQETWTVRAEDSESAQGYSPLEGHELTGKVKHVVLRGSQIVVGGSVVGEPLGRYLKRPTG
ncbi:MAG: dihydroorotase family protein [Actinomycetia bacterium]|nr:dihydroorotase family protein [Actinomycetes bacterium]